MRYLVDAREFPNPESDLVIDGKYPPFYIFDILKQVHLKGWHRTYEKAKKRADKLNKAQ